MRRSSREITPSTRLVSVREGAGWFLVRFRPIRAKATGRRIHHGVHLSHVVRAEVHASGSLEHVAELETRLPYCGRVDQRGKFSDVSDHNSVEQRLVAIV